MTWSAKHVVYFLWEQTLEDLAPLKDFGDPDLTSALKLASEILSNNSHSSSLTGSFVEIKNSSPDSPSEYYTLLNATSGMTSITYCDMADLLFCASSLTLVLEKLQVCNIKGKKGDPGFPGPIGSPGQNGDPGFPGPIGPPGITIPPGENGDHGFPGPIGPHGITGLSGEKGNPGFPGPRGEAESTSSKGAKGDVWLPGPPEPINRTL